jgi:hypothetical protein
MAAVLFLSAVSLLDAGEKQEAFQKSHKYTFAMCDYSFCCAHVSLPCVFHTLAHTAAMPRGAAAG